MTFSWLDARHAGVFRGLVLLLVGRVTPPTAPFGTSTIDACARLGRVSLAVAADVGAATLFLGHAVAQLPLPANRFWAVLEQLHFIGNRPILPGEPTLALGASIGAPDARSR